MNIIEEIKKRLAPLHPFKVILFGSRAKRSASKTSDYDLYIVTNDKFTPQNWEEKKRLYLPFLKALRDLQKYYPIDIIVHTKTMHEEFIKQDSLFAKEIQKGQTL